jgi:carbamoyltransferase
MITLGINAAFHDSSAVLVIDGLVVAAAEEERFTRIKHAKRPLPFSAWELPYHAIDYCLAAAGAVLAQVDHVAYSFDPQHFLAGRAEGEDITLPLQPSARPDPRWESPWDPLFAVYTLNAPRQLADGAPHHLKARFAGVRHDGPYRFHFIDHHLSHQASAFLAAPFDHCAVMTRAGEHDLRALCRRTLSVAGRGPRAAFAGTAVRAGDDTPGLSALERRVQGARAGSAGQATVLQHDGPPRGRR